MIITNSGIHEIDICHWLLGEDYESVQVLTGKQNRSSAKGLLDPQIMLLKTKSGVRIDVEVNMSSGYGYDIQCEVYDIEFQKWVDSVKADKLIGPSSWDGYVACVTADVLIKARDKEMPEFVVMEEQPKLYK